MFYSDFLFIFISTIYIIKFSIYLCSKIFCPLGLLCFTNPDDLPLPQLP
jgi:hypothetical protein